MQETVVILHNIRSAHNVGSIFRTADAAGVSKIYLAGVTPTPIDRFGRTRKDIGKVALGAEQSMYWEHVSDTVPLLQRLKGEGVQIVAVEQAPSAISYREFEPRCPTGFVFGNEVEGISEEIVRHSDAVVAIPMRGSKESLNVSVAAGIILFHF